MSRGPATLPAAVLPRFQQDRHTQLWAQVPAPFRVWTYALTEPPFSEVFSSTGTRSLAMPVDELSEVIQQEVAWWVWHCHATGCRRINPGWLRNALHGLIDLQAKHPSRAAGSLLEVDPAAVQRAYQEQYYRRRGQLPAPPVTRAIGHELRKLQDALSLRHDPRDWWQRDRWSLNEDPRIPARPHEPAGSSALCLDTLATPWLRAATKYYFRVSLETGQLSWGSLLTRLVSIGYFDDFVADHDLHPALVADPGEDLHGLMLEFLSALRVRQVRVGPSAGKPLAVRTVVSTQLAVAGLYLFLVDNRRAVATSTGDGRFLAVGEAHNRLWRAHDLPPARGRAIEDTDGSQYIDDTDLSRMTAAVEVLGLPSTQSTTVVRDGEQTTVFGLGDPSAMRAWLIQALTGRRASEVLMSDFNPLLSAPGISRPADRNPADQGQPAAEDEEFVAKYRYQQTKVRRAPNTIMVGQDVVAVIREQQAWTRQRLGLTASDPDPRYLFPQLNKNHRGDRARPLESYGNALGRLSDLLQMQDRHGRRLQFSHSHRLRHTKATNLLNLGAPVHVVMRYLGHVSPEMTMHYAATLTQTAEREFLRTQKIGHDGRQLDVSPQDVFDMVALSTRTDRVLPTGVCLLPPTKRCDKGNACYSCQFFATDTTHLADHQQLLADTQALIETRKRQVLQRSGRELTDDNIWLREQLTTVRALQLIIRTLEQQGGSGCQPGAGVRGREGYQPGPVPLQLTTREEATSA